MALPNPRKSEEDAYLAFMSMPEEEWRGCLFSVLGGGVFEVAEARGFARALEDRKKADRG